MKKKSGFLYVFAVAASIMVVVIVIDIFLVVLQQFYMIIFACR